MLVALLLVALLLGSVAGWIRYANTTKAKTINAVALPYALPPALLAASVENPCAKLLPRGPLALVLLVGAVRVGLITGICLAEPDNYECSWNFGR